MVKDRLQNIDDKFHASCSHRYEEHLIQRRLLQLLLGFGNNATFEIGIIIVLLHTILTRITLPWFIFHTLII